MRSNVPEKSDETAKSEKQTDAWRSSERMRISGPAQIRIAADVGDCEEETMSPWLASE